MLNVVSLLLGGSLLVAGRKLFWLFVGVIGFITGLQLAARFWKGPEGMNLVVGLVIGVIFALLAIFLETIAIAVAGFLAGGFVLTTFSTMLGIDSRAFFWIIYIVGGIIGVVLVMLLFDWALITLSSLAGASLIVQSLFSQRAAGGLIFFIIFIIGVVIQGSVLRSEEGPPRRRLRRTVRHDS
jgi:hypothetical protein